MIKNQRHGQEAPNKLQQCCSCFVWSFQPTFNNLSLIYYKLWTSKLSRIIKWLSLEKLRGENNNNIKEIVRGDLAREKCKTTTSLPTFWTASKKGYWERALLILIKYKIILNAILSPPPSSLPITHLLFSPAEKRVLRATERSSGTNDHVQYYNATKQYIQKSRRSRRSQVALFTSMFSSHWGFDFCLNYMRRLWNMYLLKRTPRAHL